MAENNAFSFTNKKGQTYFLHGRKVTLKNGSRSVTAENQI